MAGKSNLSPGKENDKKRPRSLRADNGPRMYDYDLFVSNIDDRLSAANFKLWRGVSVNQNLDTEIFATRIRWIVGRNSEHIFVQFRAAPRSEDFEQLFDQGLDYVKRAYPISLPIKLLTNYKMICCIATTNVTPELIRFVTKRPGQHWNKRIIHGYYQLPVLIDLEAHNTYWYHGLFCRGLRQMVSQYIDGLS